MNEAELKSVLVAQGKDISKSLEQLNIFKKGVSKLKVIDPVTVNNGIIQLSEDQVQEYVSYFNAHVNEFTITRFVPASGAASRMFKSLLTYYHEGMRDNLCATFFDNLNKFPFFKKLEHILKEQNHKINDAEETVILKYLLFEDGLNYSFLPKALIDFHKESNESAKPVRQHIIEALQILPTEPVINIHFTISENHHSLFLAELNHQLSLLEKEYGKKINVEYSYQDKSTDTLAVNEDNTPYLLEDNNILFRPGGHGSLLYNLNKLWVDVVYIKNIDNILPLKNQKLSIQYKQVLLSMLFQTRLKLKEIYTSLRNSENVEALNACKEYLSKTYGIEGISNWTKEEVMELINRPIRVCGMVKNVGEPGGGPFWIENNIMPQIVEKSQIDLEDSHQKEILNASTHFNPVDICCYLKNFDGEKFNLDKYVDPNTGFISYKSINGDVIKVLEHPGLWNGAMANWFTVMVEVPLESFSPVKTINDLLKPEHNS